MPKMTRDQKVAILSARIEGVDWDSATDGQIDTATHLLVNHTLKETLEPALMAKRGTLKAIALGVASAFLNSQVPQTSKAMDKADRQADLIVDGVLTDAAAEGGREFIEELGEELKSLFEAAALGNTRAVTMVGSNNKQAADLVREAFQIRTSRASVVENAKAVLRSVPARAAKDDKTGDEIALGDYVADAALKA